MSQSPDKEAGGAEQQPDDSDRPGRVEVDSRGNNVWRWARGVLDSTSVLLKRLDNKDLALEPTRKVPVLGDQGEARAPKAGAAKSRVSEQRVENRRSGPGAHGGGGGFDPYNSSRTR